MNFLGHWWIIGLLVVVLIIFGPGKLPQIGGAVGTAIKEFRKATTELKDEVTRSTSLEPMQPTPPPIVEATHTEAAQAETVQKEKSEAPKA